MATRTIPSYTSTFPKTTLTMAPSQPATSPTAPARPYKDFLTPALHRRFTTASALILSLCWVEAVLMSSSKSYLYAVLPLGTFTSLRTLLLFVPVLAVFIVRVMNMHVGTRTTTSGAETAFQLLTQFRTAGTVGWYVFSGWMFGEIYIWSRSNEAGLAWIDVGRSYERARVNENAVLLRCIFVMLAVVQATLHLSRDYDRLPLEQQERDQAQQTEEQRDSRIPLPIQKLMERLPSILNRTLTFTFCGVALSIPAYFFFLRYAVWNYYVHPIARMLHSEVGPNTGPCALTNVARLFWQSLNSVFLLIFLWEFSNAIFTLYVSLPPLKKGQPFTSEVKDASGRVLSRSRDPNGSLIRGLRAKKEVPKSFAFWELYLICTDFPQRRKTIYAEVDRKPESTWSAVSSYCLAEITSISTRISSARSDLNRPAAKPSGQEQALVVSQRQETLGLPRIASRGVQDNADVVQKRRQTDTLHTVGNLARSVGQSQNSSISPRIKKAYEQAASQVHLSEHTTGARQALNQYLQTFLSSPLGWPFRQYFHRRVRAVVLGVPHSNKINIIHAVRSLTTLAVQSLKEDDFGQVAPSVPGIVRTLTSTISDIESFVRTMPPHWTDIHFTETQRRFLDQQRNLGNEQGMDEVREVVEALKKGLEEVLLVFGEYLSQLGLSGQELRAASAAAGGGNFGAEMAQREQ